MYFTVDGLTTTTLPLPATTTTQRPAGTSQTNLNTIQAPELEEPAVVGCKLEGETHAIGTEALLKCPDGFYFPDLLQNLTVVCANNTENSIQWSPNIPECLATEDQLGLPLEMMIFSLFLRSDRLLQARLALLLWRVLHLFWSRYSHSWLQHLPNCKASIYAY